MIRIFMVGMSPNKGGVESYVRNLCANLDQTEFEIIHRLPQMIIDGKVWNCPPNRHNYIAYRRFWKRFFKENHFDVLYYNTCDIVSIDIIRFAKAAKVPVRVIHSHNTNVQVKRRFFHYLTEWYNRKHIDRYATHLLACSVPAGQWMYGGKPFQVINNGIDLKKFQFSQAYRAQCKKEQRLEGRTIIGCVGRLDPQKNPLYALDVMETVITKNSNVTCVFIGAGELQTQTEEEIRKRQLEKNILLLGARDDVYKWYSALDCLLMPSLFEGLPFVLVEAQAAGLPCVVSTNVTEDADLTGLVRFLELSQPREVWADCIMEVAAQPRMDAADRLTQMGYSIQATAAEIARMLRSAVKREV